MGIRIYKEEKIDIASIPSRGAEIKRPENYEEIYQELSGRSYLPLLNWDVMKFLEHILTKETELLELGSGASTIWFAERVKHVTSFEELSPWYYVLMDIIEEKELKNIKVYLDHRYPRATIKSFKKQFDVVLLDGGGKVGRIFCMKSCYQNVKLGGYLVVDDTHRIEEYKEELEFLDSLGWEKKEFEGDDPWSQYKKARVYRRLK